MKWSDGWLAAWPEVEQGGGEARCFLSRMRGGFLSRVYASAQRFLALLCTPDSGSGMVGERLDKMDKGWI